MHVLVAAAMYLMYRLGVWQWGRGEATGSIRNYSYGLEWWAFCGLTLAGWVKFCLDETTPEGRVRTPETPVATPELPQAVPVSADEDPALAAWNARFAALAERDRGTKA